MQKEFFGPLLAVHVYDDADWDTVLKVVDGTSEYALTCPSSPPTAARSVRPSTCCATPRA